MGSHRLHRHQRNAVAAPLPRQVHAVAKQAITRRNADRFLGPIDLLTSPIGHVDRRKLRLHNSRPLIMKARIMHPRHEIAVQGISQFNTGVYAAGDHRMWVDHSQFGPLPDLHWPLDEFVL